VAVIVAALLYLVRMFAITGFYHRYFSHRTFKTSRWLQFVFAVVASTSAQGGPLWWAAHHRHHHRSSDQPEDVHSPHQRGFLWSHLVWFMCRRHLATRTNAVRDWAKYPELRFLNRYDKLAPLALAALLFGVGEILRLTAPGLRTSGWQLLVWGFFISTVVLLHATLAINSLAHVWGRRRYATRDYSRNNLFLALITLGEGWHNNHHYCPGAVRQGFRWWEVDITYYVLCVMSWLGLVWGLRPVPGRAYAKARRVAGPDGNAEAGDG
jgi:stearoyl-CoA desaturase (delta-9 desaturase)